MSGSVMSFEWESQNTDAIIQAWYGGQSAGDAIVDVLFGNYNPAGRMPLTTYMSDADLPPFEDYSMANRTYRYFKGQVRYPFGYGLSYTDFSYTSLKSEVEEIETGKDFQIKTTVSNVGKYDGDEVIQLYVTHPQNGQQIIPICSLKGFKRIHLRAGESKEVSFTLTPEDLALTDNNGNTIEQAGTLDIFVGGGQPQYAKGNKISLKVKGDNYQIF